MSNTCTKLLMDQSEVRNTTRDVKELRGFEGGRVYYRRADGKIEILGKSDKIPRDQRKVINILEELY